MAILNSSVCSNLINLGTNLGGNITSREVITVFGT